MLNQFSRTELLLGKEALDKLAGSRVAVFGIGGVGGYVCEALVRSGVGEFDLVDDDKVCLTNLTVKQIVKSNVNLSPSVIFFSNPLRNLTLKNVSSYQRMPMNFHLRNMTTSLMPLTQ